MSFKLPPSLDRNLHTLQQETAFARALTPEQRLAVVALVCRAAAQTLALNAKRELLLAYRDPLPASTLAALRRLLQAQNKTPLRLGRWHDR